LAVRQDRPSMGEVRDSLVVDKGLGWVNRLRVEVCRDGLDKDRVNRVSMGVGRASMGVDRVNRASMEEGRDGLDKVQDRVNRVSMEVGRLEEVRVGVQGRVSCMGEDRGARDWVRVSLEGGRGLAVSGVVSNSSSLVVR